MNENHLKHMNSNSSLPRDNQQPKASIGFSRGQSIRNGLGYDSQNTHTSNQQQKESEKQPVLNVENLRNFDKMTKNSMSNM